MLRRLFAGTVVALGVSAAGAVPAFASAAYCRWDPPVVVTTPSGQLDVVYVDVSSPFANVGEGLASASTTRGYTSTGAPDTIVTMRVWVPSGLFGAFPVDETVSSGLLGSGTLYAEASGMSGRTITMQFTLDTP